MKSVLSFRFMFVFFLFPNSFHIPTKNRNLVPRLGLTIKKQNKKLCDVNNLHSDNIQIGKGWKTTLYRRENIDLTHFGQ